MRNKILMTLALLLTAVTGAWATDPNTVTWNGNGATWKGWTDSETTHTVGDITITCSGNAKAYEHNIFSGKPLAMVAGNNDAITFTSNGAPFTSIKIKMYGDTDPGLAGWTWDNGHNIEWSGTPSTSVTLSGCDFAADMITFTFAPAGPEVAWDAATKTGTFEMPAYDVEIAPIYAPVAQWAKDKEVDQIPASIEGIYAGTTDAIVTAGTVAMMGKTENPQGIVMYAVTSTNQATAPELSAFSATLPTAKDIADEGADVLVWYYIKGADTPQGETATAENTFNDSEICATPLPVTVLSNKFDLTLNAANANTIEAGKATVKVGETAAEVKEGKLTGVKMNSKVTITAKQGYKFRKVEVEKAAPVIKPDYADEAEELPENSKLYLRTDLVNVGDWIWTPSHTAEQAQAVADYYAAITGTKCAVIYGHAAESDIYYVTSDNGVSGTITRSDNLTTKFPGYKVYLLK